MVNKQILLASRPTGWVAESNFMLAESEPGSPADGEVLVRNIYMSVDPYMRGRMNDMKSYIPPFQVGEVLQAGVVGQVLESKFDGIHAGDHVMGTYVGLTKIAEARAGDNVFVTAASGAVGSVVGQLAKILGCRVAGSAGSDDKVALLKEELGYDAGFNYKTSESLSDSVREACPEGVDVLFENVGGDIFEAALWNMRDYGRVALCGMISDYNLEEPRPGPRGMALIVGRRLRIQGFIVTDHPEACEEYVGKAIGWLQEGKLKYRESIVEGIENAPQAFIDLLKGNHTGKQIVQLSETD
jgi:NADPH-dependent curcumin reductase CurA